MSQIYSDELDINDNRKNLEEIFLLKNTPITSEGLIDLGFEVVESTLNDDIYGMYGIYLKKINEHWYTQIGGTDNFWEYFENQNLASVILLMMAMVPLKGN